MILLLYTSNTVNVYIYFLCCCKSNILWPKISDQVGTSSKISYTHTHTHTHEGCLKSSWTHLITPSQNFVEVRWRSLFQSTSLGKRCTSYNATPTSRKRAPDRWPLRNFLPRSSLFLVGKAQKSHWARSELYGGCSNGVPPIHFFQAEHRIQFRSRPMRFLDFSNQEKGAPRQEISKWSTVCSTFSRSGWSVVRSASLAKGGTSKKRPSPHLHKVSTRSNKASPRTLQMTLIYIYKVNFTHAMKVYSCLGDNVPHSLRPSHKTRLVVSSTSPSVCHRYTG
jgi:hypothetical protein